MTEPIREAKEALGVRLRELRLSFGMSGTELARQAGWHQTRVPKIEFGKTKPTEADIRLWCTLTGAEDQIADLVATLRHIDAAYLEWRRLLATGTKRRQQLSVKLEAETEFMRWYEPALVPGLLQTARYAEEILRNVIEFYQISDDLGDGVAKRMERQQILYRRNHRFHFVLAEQALQTTVGDDDVMLGQLDRLLTVASIPRITLGIVPMRTPYRTPISNFIMFDDRRIMIENLTAELTITQPREIALYGRAFNALARQAATGETARNLIQAEIDIRSHRTKRQHPQPDH